ncbi:MAG TPA: ferric reductase-like transmembrane domain-containing protein [Candidatus Angelobacter sp.]|nr:ferric reductase-like transmembrane domain-containing protein [Candidatus Angelobacter sp.]
MTTASPLWYTTRAAGMVLLILLTLTVVLGILTNGRWSAAGIPRFVPNSLHRNVSLLAVVFLVLHILTAIIDPFAHLGLKDALIPFASSYRPLWLGLGVLGAELFMALVITSLVRGLLGYGLWRLTHWLAYVSWPISVLHGLGTGSDTKSWWALLINITCVSAVLLALTWRIAAIPGRSGARTTLATASALGALILVGWTLRGPLQPGWAVAAGTPANLLAQVSPSAAASGSPGQAAYTLPAGLRDQLQGQLQQDANGGALVTLVDLANPSLKVIIGISDPQATAVTVVVNHGTQAVCSSQASVTQSITATCGTTRLSIEQLSQQADGTVVGLLVTRAGG